MNRSPGAAGFGGHSTPVASPRLTDAVVASLAFSAFCLVVALTMLTIKSGLTI